MFDIGFSELCLVALISLLVIGPEKLPKVARIVGFWIGKTRSTMASLKAEIREELHAEEIRQSLKQQTGMKEIKDVLDEAADTAYSIKSSVNDFQNASQAHETSEHESK